ncbi:MAG: SGNH hydrolase domain-containing protein, partial [Akkermansia muciniphila]
GLCRFIPLHGTFHKNGRWQAEDGGQLMYCDDNHLSPYGAKKMVGGIIDQLFPGMERTAAN